MQRKNRILKRRGIAMIMAIVMILVMGGIMGVVISMSSDTTRRTNDIYLHEQALTLTRSATEYALLAVSGHDHKGLNNCINRIDMQYPSVAEPMFDINISLRYIGFGQINPGNDAQCVDFIPDIGTSDSNGSILMDVTVTSNAFLNLDEPIRYHRRTMQKM